MRVLVIGAIVAMMILSGGCSGGNKDYGKGTAIINEKKFTVEVPLTQEGFLKGLMHRTQLADNKGMLFAYQDSAIRAFWMKNTLIPLDMLFIDEKGVIRKIHHATPCKAEPCPHYLSEMPIKYVLEIRGNLTKELGIREGDKAEISIRR